MVEKNAKSFKSSRIYVKKKKNKGEFINETIIVLLVGAIMRKFFLSIRTYNFIFLFLWELGIRIRIRIRVYFILFKRKRVSICYFNNSNIIAQFVM